MAELVNVLAIIIVLKFREKTILVTFFELKFGFTDAITLKLAKKCARRFNN